jgi:hypothetical protein
MSTGSDTITTVTTPVPYGTAAASHITVFANSTLPAPTSAGKATGSTGADGSQITEGPISTASNKVGATGGLSTSVFSVTWDLSSWLCATQAETLATGGSGANCPSVAESTSVTWDISSWMCATQAVTARETATSTVTVTVAAETVYVNAECAVTATSSLELAQVSATSTGHSNSTITTGSLPVFTGAATSNGIHAMGALVAGVAGLAVLL